MHLHSNHRDEIDAAFDQLKQIALSDYAQKQISFEAVTAPFLRWNIDEVKSLLRFTGGSLPTLDNRITPIATYLPSAEDWAWAWANDAFPDHARLKASRIKALSTKTGYVIFETAFFRAKPMDIDELCALALHELNGRTVFKVKDREPWVYYIVD